MEELWGGLELPGINLPVWRRTFYAFQKDASIFVVGGTIESDSLTPGLPKTMMTFTLSCENLNFERLLAKWPYSLLSHKKHNAHRIKVLENLYSPPQKELKKRTTNLKFLAPLAA
ncbi:hypothetical protein J2Y83_000577 [Pseudomonas marginalis]|uniref:hypothetical protein n=1 Tax=Pseudomonas marginalis TaxID=298 RepID=UPI0020A0F5E1|nr:hypothetical protein [Pseudomonas marginalis]MCP1510450.1 hypothetical protein [Pseudomonas marginalis]MCP1522108.1 hypothetical protein [Pseudomonas marginalis]MDQ0501088.1 hypothetical protein [Pseudomonas marginalis]